MSFMGIAGSIKRALVMAAFVAAALFPAVHLSIKGEIRNLNW